MELNDIGNGTKIGMLIWTLLKLRHVYVYFTLHTVPVEVV